MQSKHFPYLDGLRGIAAFLVVFHHSSQMLTGHSALPNAHLAVDLFFCLSGFVISRAYEPKLSRGMSFLTFMRIRLVRLGPLLFMGAALGSAAAVANFQNVGSHPFARAMIADAPAFLMIPSGLLLHQEPFPTNPPMWSLFFELLANVAFAWLFVRKILSGIPAVLLMAAGLAASAWWFGDVDVIGHSSTPSFVAGLFRVGFAFFTGVIISRMINADKLPRWASDQRTTIGAIFLMTAILLLPESVWWSDLVVIFVAIPATITTSTAAAGGLGRLACKYLGEISYPIYLIHYPIIYAMLSQHAVKQICLAYPGAFYTVVLTVLFFISMLTSRFYDVPLRDWLSSGARR